MFHRLSLCHRGDVRHRVCPPLYVEEVRADSVDQVVEEGEHLDETGDMLLIERHVEILSNLLLIGSLASKDCSQVII